MPERSAAGLQVLLALLLLLLGNGCIYARIVYFNTPTLAAPKIFDSRAIHTAQRPTTLQQRATEQPFRTRSSRHTSYASLAALLESNQTRAFIAVKDDMLVYERYFGGVSRETLLPAFSITKTYAAALVGRALDQGLLGSLGDPVVKYVPELRKNPGYEQVTLEQLLRMISGIDFDEESTAGAALYYCTDLHERSESYAIRWPPGQHYLYGSVNVQLLWEALHRRLGARSVSDYFAEEVWAPLGAERDASWSLDSSANGVEKFFGGFNATARDHALLGLLYLHRGTLNGHEILNKAWVERSLSPDPVAGRVRTADGLVSRGHYQWFLTLDGRAYFAKGYHGQYIFVVPEQNAVFVRFGEGYGDVDWPALFLALSDEL